MKFYLAAGLVGLGLLSGCADSSTHGTEKDIQTTITFNVSGGSTVAVTSPLSLESSTDQKQDTAGKSTVSPTTRLQLTEGGSTAAGEASNLSDIVSSLRQRLNSDNKTETTTTTPPKIENTTPAKINTDIDDGTGEASPGIEEPSEDLDWKNKATYTSYGVRNGGRQAWRIPGKGPSFGETIKFVFSSGKTFTVTDTSKNCRDNQETCNRSSSSDMYGFVFKPGIGPNGDGDDNPGTAHGGIYLHAPYGDSSKQVTIYYNK